MMTGLISVPRVLGDVLDRLGELDLQAPRQVEAVLGLHHVRDAALAGLAVDANDRLVRAADVLRDRSAGTARPTVVVRRGSAAKPFLIASWWLPLNDV